MSIETPVDQDCPRCHCYTLVLVSVSEKEKSYRCDNCGLKFSIEEVKKPS